MFLDGDLQYSYAYFTDLDLDLDAAQRANKTHIAAKLLLEPGARVLDIGCGWGSMTLTLARDYGVRVTRITLSENQLAIARCPAEHESLSELATFELQDYRATTSTYDRTVSVGMLEHIGASNYGE